jgi:hypothetical protein
VRCIGWICYQIAAEQPYNYPLTKDQFDSLMDGVKFALENPNMKPEENHDNWMKMKLSQGWKYGDIKDLKKKTHPDLVPYEDLPEIEKRKDSMDKLINKLANELWEMIKC